MSAAAERARLRDQFVASYPFPIDRFQSRLVRRARSRRPRGRGGPTGSGKTVVAEYGIAAARHDGLRAFYTAPIKALSNQKYRDLVAIHGEDDVGLLTGDNSINGDAPIVVMTTEVLRNMIYGRSRLLHDLGLVVLDEVHFLQDSYRGPVWEEVMIHLPQHVRLVCLSATVSATSTNSLNGSPPCGGRRRRSSSGAARFASTTSTSSPTGRTTACACCRCSSTGT